MLQNFSEILRDVRGKSCGEKHGNFFSSWPWKFISLHRTVNTKPKLLGIKYCKLHGKYVVDMYKWLRGRNNLFCF